MRDALRSLVGLVATLGLLISVLPNTASADPPGNNGTVKIHDSGTPQEDRRNEPHVCEFYIAGFGFDGDSSGTWRIDQHPPTGRANVADDTWTADGDGNWRSKDMTLPDGHYKLYAEQTATDAPGGFKQKVFWVDCGEEQGAPPPAGGGQGGGNGNQPSAPTQPTGTQSRTGTGTKTRTGTKPTATGTGTGTATGTKPSGSVTGTETNTATGTVGGTQTATATGTAPTATATATGTKPSGSVTGTVTQEGEQAEEEQAEQHEEQLEQQQAVAGFQAGPTGAVTPISEAEAAAAVAGVQNLPSTSTAPASSGSLAYFGMAMTALGAFMLRRRPH